MIRTPASGTRRDHRSIQSFQITSPLVADSTLEQCDKRQLGEARVMFAFPPEAEKQHTFE